MLLPPSPSGDVAPVEEVEKTGEPLKAPRICHIQRQISYLETGHKPQDLYDPYFSCYNEDFIAGLFLFDAGPL